MGKSEGRSVESEAVEFNGIIFRRYPKSKRMGDRRYYRPNGKYVLAGVETLHREVWKEAHGPIPEGCHIHHIDGDTLNNDISNLACVPGREHISAHKAASPQTEKERRTELLRTNQRKANAWHSTDAGKKWHSAHGRESWMGRAKTMAICTVCGKEYGTYFPERSIYCSPECNSKIQHERGKSRPKPPIKYEERICQVCGRSFSINKYYKNKFCGYQCSGIAKRGKPRPRVRSDGKKRT